MGIRLGVHKWTFPAASCREAAQLARALGFRCLDLGNAPDLDPLVIAQDPERAAARFQALQAETGIQFVDCFPQWPADPFATTHPDPAVRAEIRQMVAGMLRFAQALGLAGLTLSPGRRWPGEPFRAVFQRAVDELRWAVEAGQARGVAVRIEPHIESVAWTPELTLELLAQVPGLGLTLDHSHFVFHGLVYEDIAVLHPYAQHWHARQARPGAAQARFAEGTIPFDRIFQDLQARGYGGVVCLEYVHGAWMGQDNVDCLTETIRLRDFLLTWGGEV